jgi:hypothetical protein
MLGIEVDMSSDTDEFFLTGEPAMPSGRRVKVVKPPNRVERSENLRKRIVGLSQELIDSGFGALLVPPGPIKLLAAPVQDPKTSGWIGHVEESLSTYIQRVSVTDNFSQRPPFDHVNDPIYRRLIRDFIHPGAAMPEAKVAALRPSGQSRIAENLDVPDVYYSIVDGLQRLYCYCIAILLVWRREELVSSGLIPKDAWDYLSEAVLASGDPKAATEALLQRMTRYEVFYNIDLGGLLHYMVTFNTGQRRMSLPVQLEIMQGPLIQELESTGIPIWHDIHTLPGMRQPKEKFAASTLVLATQAFITNNAQVTASTEAENFLNESQQYLDNVGDINDVAHTIHRITTELHPDIMRVYADDPNRRYILSGGTFLLGLAAACGYIRNRNKMKTLDQALDRLLKELKKPVEDPWNLTSYQQALSMITSSRGKATRRLVYDTFLRFFSGATGELEWLDTAAQITGSTL